MQLIGLMDHFTHGAFRILFQKKDNNSCSAYVLELTVCLCLNTFILHYKSKQDYTSACLLAPLTTECHWGFHGHMMGVIYAQVCACGIQIYRRNVRSS